MKYRKIENKNIPRFNPVTVTQLGNTLKIQYVSRRNEEAKIIKINKNEYLHVKTGEIKEFSIKDDVLSNTRLGNIQSLRNTFKKIQELVACNVTYAQKIRWITLTYKDNMTDTKQLYDDFRKFNMRFKYYCQKNDYGTPEYLLILEPQQRGAWHIHMFYIWETKAPFIPNDMLSKLWGFGFTKIQALNDVDNIAGYLTSYLTDMELDNEQSKYFSDDEIKTIERNGVSKKYLKGGRLHLYKRHMHIVRHSRGIKKPIKQTMQYFNAMKLIGNRQLKYNNAYQLSDESGFAFDVIVEEYR